MKSNAHIRCRQTVVSPDDGHEQDRGFSLCWWSAFRLERRALIFRDVHPLSLQTSPTDGVARGVIVSRTIKATADVLKGLFLRNLQYEIVEDEWNWLLVDQITRSPVRVVTKDPILTTAFWSEDWNAAQPSPGPIG